MAAIAQRANVRTAAGASGAASRSRRVVATMAPTAPPPTMLWARRHGGPLHPRRSVATATTTTDAADTAAASAAAPDLIASIEQSFAASVAESAAPAADQQQPIDWHRQWYPLAAVDDLDPTRPTAVQLLGKRLVVWRDPKGGQWSVLEDRCPHRLAPLSEGRVEPKTGNLMCAYHGHEFDAAGKCVAMPQMANDDRALSRALSSGRSCATRYPSQVAQGLLWAWADPSPEGVAAAEGAPIASRIPEADDEEAYEARTGWFVRDTPLSLDTVLENILDPCHAPFAHHGVQGRRENERGTSITPAGPPTAAGFSCEHQAFRPGGAGGFRAQFGFTAPTLVNYKFPALGRVMSVHAVPSAMGQTRLMARFYRYKSGGDGSVKLPFVVRLFLGAMEAVEANAVLGHAIVRNAVIDGDNYLLHVQERVLLAEADARAAAAKQQQQQQQQQHDHNHDHQQHGHDHSAAAAAAGGAWRASYFMPGKYDTGVALIRVWLERFGRGLPVLPKTASDLPPMMTRREALDRFSQHTQHCRACSRALSRIDAALPVLAAAAGALLAAAVYAVVFAGAPATGARALGAAAGAAVLAFARHKLLEFRELFVFRDYVHAEKN